MGAVTKCGGLSPGNHVAPREINALQSRRGVTPKNAFIQRTVGTVIHPHASVTFTLSTEFCEYI